MTEDKGPTMGNRPLTATSAPSPQKLLCVFDDGSVLLCEQLWESASEAAASLRALADRLEGEQKKRKTQKN